MECTANIEVVLKVVLCCRVQRRVASLYVETQSVSVYRALLSVYRALLSVYRARATQSRVTLRRGQRRVALSLNVFERDVEGTRLRCRMQRRV